MLSCHRTLPLFIFATLFSFCCLDLISSIILSSNSLTHPLLSTLYYWTHLVSFQSLILYFCIGFPRVFFIICISLIIFSIFFCFKVICNYLLKHFYNVTLQFLSDNANISFILILATVDSLSSFQLWFSWFLVWVSFCCIYVICLSFRRRHLI